MLEYVNSGSMVHKLDPRAKFFFALMMMLSAIFTPSLPALMALAGICLAVLAAAGVLRGMVKPLLMAMVVFTIIGVSTQSIFYTDLPGYSGPRTVLFTLMPWDVPVIGPLPVTVEGIRYGLVLSVKLMAISLPFMIIPFTTHPSEMILMLRKMRFPEWLILLVTMSLRFMPLTFNNFYTIRDAQRLRKERRGLSDILMLLETLMVVSLRTARQTALALESRAFCLAGERTSLRTIKFNNRDTAFTLFSAAILVVVVSGVA